MYGNICYLVAFKGGDGKSYRSWIYKDCRNFKNWKPVLDKGEGTIVGNLVIKNKKDRLIDADSLVVTLNSLDEKATNHLPREMKDVFDRKKDPKAIKALDQVKNNLKKKGVI